MKDESILSESYSESILNNINNKRGFCIGDPVYIKTTNAVGRIIDGGNTKTWNDTCRTDTDGVRSFGELEHLVPEHFNIKDLFVPNGFKRLDKFQQFILSQIESVTPSDILTWFKSWPDDVQKEAFNTMCQKACINENSKDAEVIFKHLKRAEK